jgi:hypothetical protein
MPRSSPLPVYAFTADDEYALTVPHIPPARAGSFSCPLRDLGGGIGNRLNWVVCGSSQFARRAMPMLESGRYRLKPRRQTLRLFQRCRWQVDGQSDILEEVELP